MELTPEPIGSRYGCIVQCVCSYLPLFSVCSGEMSAPMEASEMSAQMEESEERLQGVGLRGG